MSGHSKWSKIQHKKGAIDKARSNLFTKLCRAITIAAREGGADAEMNFSLRLAVEKAKAGNVPKDNIERAIKRGTGELKDGAELQEILYEGFGPGGVGLLIFCVTDNTNRTVSEVKHVLTRFGGSLGSPGSVAWQFGHKGVIELKEKPNDDLALELIEEGVEDIQDTSLFTPPTKLQAVIEVLKKHAIEPEDSGLEWIPKEPLKIDDQTTQTIVNIIQALNELDDVSDVFVGADFV